MLNKAIYEFIRVLVGTYSNKKQSLNDPRLFAHINLYFRPLPWSIFKCPLIYSEQSYDYSPWNPYRQALHSIRTKNNTFKIENYKIEDPLRVAGAGFQPELLESLKDSSLIKREGCAMEFKEMSKDKYFGNIEQGNSCLVKHSGEMTYISSKVILTKGILNILDEGFEINTNKKIWGSKNGPIIFNKILSHESDIDYNWINYRYFDEGLEP